MKTFKLVGVQVIDDHLHRQQIPLIDGLIINKEDGRNRWLVETYIDKQYEPLFAKLQRSQDEVRLEVTISHTGNDPAYMLATIHLLHR